MKRAILNLVFVMRAGDLSYGEASFRALTISFLLSLPSPFLSRNMKAWMIVSKVASS